MRILYLYPGPLSAVEGGTEELKRRQSILRALAPADVVRDVTHGGHPSKGPVSFETAYEGFILVGGAARALEQAEAEGYDAAVLGCFGDPGLERSPTMASSERGRGVMMVLAIRTDQTSRARFALASKFQR